MGSLTLFLSPERPPACSLMARTPQSSNLIIALIVSSGPCAFYMEHDPGLAFPGRPALGLQPSLPWTFQEEYDPNRNRLLFSDPAGNRVEFPLGLPTEFLVIVSGKLLPLNSLEEKRSPAPLRLGTSQPCTGEITFVHGHVFSGLACPRGCPHPVSIKGRE